MKNNKGFTLMELMAAIFIGGMVTAALVLVWKTASTQTSQGQRQTVMRNQVSNFQRQLYKDFYSADLITFPTANYNANASAEEGETIQQVATIILAGLKKAKRISDTEFQIMHRDPPQGPTKSFVYCVVNNQILRSESEEQYSAEFPVQDISSYGAALLTTCQNSGIPILTHFTLTEANITTNGIYTLSGYVRRVFPDVANTTPIYIEIEETLATQGGI